MNWLVKTEPSDYSFAQLQKDGRTVWSGVRNPVAQKHLRSMKKGDGVLVYHTGGEKAAVGLARAASAPYADPKDASLSVVELEAVRPLEKPVTLASVKADPAFKDFALVRIGRLSVMPVDEAQWRRLMGMAGE